MALKTLDQAPHGKAVLLYLPGVYYKTTADGKPSNVSHGWAVGWWSEAEKSWVVGLHPEKGHTAKVHPSGWTELPDPPPEA